MTCARLTLSCFVAQCVLFAAAAQAATFTVTKTADTNDGSCNADCSLREAIVAANALAGTDTVTIPAGTYTLTRNGSNEDATVTGDLDITGTLTINGAGSGSTIIDGNGNDRIFDVRGGATATVSGVTIRNGNGGGDGGGIRNLGSLSVSGATLSGNTATRGGGIQSSGAGLRVADSLFTQNTSNNQDGGAIQVTSGTVTISTVTFNGNTASRRGGALHATNSATNITISDSTFASNQSTGNDGGAIYADDSTLTLSRTTFSGNIASRDGGALWIRDSVTTMTNVTISGNSAPGDDGGGIRADSGTVRLNNVTVTGNSASRGGGIFRQGGTPVILFNTIVANSVSGGNCNNAVTSLGNNLDSANTCLLTGSGDLTNSNANLGALQNNGGPTQTHALGAGSAAIDSGSNSGCPATDQRGVARPVNGLCDIGAYEGGPSVAANLGLTMTDAPDPVFGGTQLSYTLTVNNSGPGTATTVALTDTLPATAVFVSATPSQGSCNQSGGSPGGTISCALGTVANGASATVVIVVTAPLADGLITNSATVSAAGTDPDPSNNSASADTTVTIAGVADLALAKSDSPDPVRVNQLLSYSLVVSNQGPGDAADVVLVDTLPPTVTFQSAIASQGSCVHSAGTVTCTLGAIANAANATVAIVVVPPSSTGSITNNASVSTSSIDPNPANDNATQSTTVQNINVNQVCYLVADSGGGGGGDDLLTRIDTADFNPATNETNIGIGTGTNAIEAIVWNSATQVLYGANGGRLGTLNTVTGVFAQLPQAFGTGTGSLGSITFSDVDGLTYDATTGILYGAHARSGTDVLIQINMTTGAHVPNAFGAGVDYVPIAPIAGNNITDDIAVDPTTGVMYASTNSGGSTDRLVIVNKLTGATSSVGVITVPDIEGLGTDPTGQLWGTSGTQGILYELNKATGEGTNPRPINNGSDYEAVDCYAFSPSVIADLAVSKSVNDPTPSEADTVIYTVTVSNAGPGPATVVQLTDVLPASVTFVSAAPSQGTYDNGSGAWFVGTIASGNSATLDIQASVNIGTAGTTVSNTASVTYASQNDPNSANNSASVDIVIEGRPDILVMKSVMTLQDPLNGTANPKAIPGATAMYTITVTNLGSGNADTNSLVVTEPVAASTALRVADFDGSNAGPVAFVDGTPASGLTYSFASLGDPGDDVEFSNDGGASYTYTPVADASGTDLSVTHMRIRPKGALLFSATGNPNFSLLFKNNVE